MKIAQLALWILLIFNLGLTSHAESFESAIALYEDGKIKAAADAFEKLAVTNETPAIRHNLAITHFQQDQKGEASWQIERALRLAPANQEYRSKQAAIRSDLGLYENPWPWYKSLALFFSFQTWILLLNFGIWCILIAVLLPMIITSRSKISQQTLISVGLIICLLSIPATLYNLQDRKTGHIIAAEAVPILAAPAKGTPEVGIARIGEAAKITDQHQGFYQVTTQGQVAGWIADEHFRPLYSIK